MNILGRTSQYIPPRKRTLRYVATRPPRPFIRATRRNDAASHRGHLVWKVWGRGCTSRCSLKFQKLVGRVQVKRTGCTFILDQGVRPRRRSARDCSRRDGPSGERKNQVQSSRSACAARVRTLRRSFGEERGFSEFTSLQVEKVGTKARAPSYQRGKAPCKMVSTFLVASCSSASSRPSSPPPASNNSFSASRPLSAKSFRNPVRNNRALCGNALCTWCKEHFHPAYGIPCATTVRFKPWLWAMARLDF